MNEKKGRPFTVVYVVSRMPQNVVVKCTPEKPDEHTLVTMTKVDG